MSLRPYKESGFYKAGKQLEKLGKAMQNPKTTIPQLTLLAHNAGLTLVLKSEWEPESK